MKDNGRRIMFEHPCRVCGSVDAPWGFGVDLLRGLLGRWYCSAHRHAEDALLAATQDGHGGPAQGGLL
jgi:hypothetical protein